MLEELLYYWKTARPEDFNPGNLSLRALSYYPLRIIAAEWVNYVAVMCFSLRQYDYNPSATASSAQDLDRIHAALHTLLSWPRRVLSTTTKLRRTIRFIQYHEEYESPSESWSTLQMDYEHLILEIEKHGKQLKATISLVTAYLQLAKARRASSESRTISRLTALALIFVPLSFVASLFSMNEIYVPGGPQFGLYFAVAIPLLMIVLLIYKADSVWFLVFLRHIKSSSATIGRSK